jgi:anti-sigma B factor antagonist
MNLTQEKINGSTVLLLQEERIDAHNSGELKAFVLDLLEKGEIKIVVQLEKVRFIDSSGLGALLSGHKNAESKSGQFSLVGLQPQVLSMFELTRLNRVFEIYPDMDAVFDNEL